MTARLNQVLMMNPEFATALRKGEPWAIKHAEGIRGIDGQASRRHPERAFKEDGTIRRNWCGSCAYVDGCVTCDLDGDHNASKGQVGKLKY